MRDEEYALELEEDGLPSMRALLDALSHPGPMLDHPVVRWCLSMGQARQQPQRPQLRLIQGGRDAS
jgi:hypothetical protein